MNKKQNDYYDALDNLLDRPIAFNPAFKKITGRTSAAVWLSQVYYWSKRTSDPDGWFWKTAKECEKETGLTDNEQKTARDICVKLGIIEEKLKGVPATMYYRFIKSRMYELLGLQFPTEQETEITTPQETTFPPSGKPVTDEVGNINTEITPETTPEITKEKDILDGIIHYQLKPKAIQDAIRTYFKLTPNWTAKFNRQFLEWAIQECVTPEQIRTASQVWGRDKRFNWSHPNLKGIQEHWLQLIEIISPTPQASGETANELIDRVLGV